MPRTGLARAPEPKIECGATSESEPAVAPGPEPGLAGAAPEPTGTPEPGVEGAGEPAGAISEPGMKGASGLAGAIPEHGVTAGAPSISVQG
eukprot:2326771-Amphidinium_carterae.1